MKLDDNLKEFLQKGKLSQSMYWDNQLAFFLVTIFFILIQTFVSKIIPALCTMVVVISLLYCKKMEKNKYANVYNSFIHMVLWSIIWWIDGWLALYLLIPDRIYYVICLMGNVLYILCLIWRIMVVRKKIDSSWYRGLSSKGINTAGVVAFSVLMGGTMRIIFKNITLDQNAGFALIAMCFFALVFLYIFCVDLGMRAYYFAKLTEEDQNSI